MPHKGGGVMQYQKHEEKPCKQFSVLLSFALFQDLGGYTKSARVSPAFLVGAGATPLASSPRAAWSTPQRQSHRLWWEGRGTEAGQAAFVCIQVERLVVPFCSAEDLTVEKAESEDKPDVWSPCCNRDETHAYVYICICAEM